MRAPQAVLAALLLWAGWAASAAAAPAWLPPAELAPEVAGDAADVAVAVAPDGTAVAAWSRPADGGPVVEAARRRPGQSWSAPLAVTPEGARGRGPQVGMDAAGNAYVTWREEPPGAVRAARLPAAAGAFEPAQTLSSGAEAGVPAIGVGADGMAIVVYEDGARGARVLMAAIRAPGDSAFADPARISTAFEDFQNASGRRPAAEVAVGPSGAAVAAWAAFDGRRHLVQTNERGAAGGFSSAGDTRSSQSPGASGTDPAVAVDAAGSATLAWTADANAGDAGNPTEVRWTERPPGGGFGPDAGVEPAGGEAGPTGAPDLAAAADGTVVGAWVAGTGDARTVQLAVRPPGGAFGGGATIGAPAPAGAPLVRANAAGDALVTWLGPGGEAIYAVRRGRGGAVGRQQTAANRAALQPAGAAADLLAPAVGVDDEGNATAVWAVKADRAGAQSFRVMGAGYDAAAPTIVSAVTGGTVVAGRPLRLSATAVDRWTPVTYAWSFGDETFATGPAVRHRYAAAGSYTIGLTATDAVGNAAVAAGTATVRRRLRVRARVAVRWATPPGAGRVVLLRRLEVRRAPRRAVVRLGCTGRRCPLRAKTVRRGGRRGPIDVAAALRPRQRRFRPGQVVTLRITAPRRDGMVIRYRLRRRGTVQSQVLCLPAGTTTPRRRCAARA